MDISQQVLVGAYGADAVRYYFMAEIEFGKDGDFSEARFRNKVPSCNDSVQSMLAGGADNMTQVFEGRRLHRGPLPRPRHLLLRGWLSVSAS